jgi:hypothetical protein
MPEWVELTEMSGELVADNLRGLLEAQGIPVLLNQEGAGRALGLSVGPLGLTQVLIPQEYLAEARKVLLAYEAGEYANLPPLDADQDQSA